jgi:hypothetical protein
MGRTVASTASALVVLSWLPTHASRLDLCGDGRRERYIVPAGRRRRPGRRSLVQEQSSAPSMISVSRMQLPRVSQSCGGEGVFELIQEGMSGRII